jgi:uncharacterized protein YkwD
MTRQLWFPILMGLLCLGTTPAVAAPAATGRQTRTAVTMSSTEFESRLLVRTNARRQARGCRALRWNAALTLAARRHSTRMSDQRLLSHRLAGEPGLGTRATRAGYTNWHLLAENLAWGQSSPRAVFRAWVHSAPHRANLDNCRLRDVGFGVVILNGRPWVTADFGRTFG